MEAEVITLEDRLIPCEYCDGSGNFEYTTMIEDWVDAMIDYNEGPCPICGGSGYEGVEQVEVAV